MFKKLWCFAQFLLVQSKKVLLKSYFAWRIFLHMTGPHDSCRWYSSNLRQLEQIFRRNIVENQYKCFVYTWCVILRGNVAPCLQMTCKWPKKHFVVSHKKKSPYEALKPSGNRLFRDAHNSIFFDKRNFLKSSKMLKAKFSDSNGWPPIEKGPLWTIQSPNYGQFQGRKLLHMQNDMATRYL